MVRYIKGIFTLAIAALTFLALSSYPSTTTASQAPATTIPSATPLDAYQTFTTMVTIVIVVAVVVIAVVAFFVFKSKGPQ